MALSPGDRLGPYEILSPLGAGGMGEVYKALDTRLDRTVAVKVLPEHIAKREDLRARFEREARAVASLKHPNICTLYDIGSQDGAGYMVMEFMEGETLAARIGKGALPLDQALKFATQIADALDRAHRAGVTHRDVKPQNIMLTRDGAKVLDFGLAKSIPKVGPTDETLTAVLTTEGTVMGTPQYMAPEQFEGKEADARSDIWAFGAVLYEMVTGQKAFQGKSYSSLLGAILSADPPPMSVKPFTPSWLERLVRRCLAKDPEDRCQTMRDVVIELQTQPQAPDEAAQRAEHIAPRALAAALGAAVAGLAILGFLHFRETVPEKPRITTSILPPAGTEFRFTQYTQPVLSPDGTRVVFGASGPNTKLQLWLRRLDTGEVHPVPGTEDPIFPFWSPDSRHIGFGADLALKKVDINGGPPTTLVDGLPQPLRGGSWSPRGIIIFGENGPYPLQQIADSGGKPKPAAVYSETDTRGHRFPWFLPDGNHFLYISTDPDENLVLVGSLDAPDKPGKEIVKAHSPAIFANGHLLYLRDNSLMAQPFDLNKLEVSGEALPIAENIATYLQPSRVAGISVANPGLLLLDQSSTKDTIRLVWVDRTGKELGSLPGDQIIARIELSPNGRAAAAVVWERGNSDVWLYDVDRGSRTRFTFDPNQDGQPVWSPDGSTVYWRSASQNGRILKRPADGSAAEQVVLQGQLSDRAYNLTSISPDGSVLLFNQGLENRSDEILALSLVPNAPPPKPLPLSTKFSDMEGRFSPDGKWIVYQSTESGRSEIYAMPYPGPGGKHQISISTGARGPRFPRWSRDGKEIYYVDLSTGDLIAVDVTIRDGALEVGKPHRLFGGLRTEREIPYDTADGKRFLVIKAGERAGANDLTLIQNWTKMLTR